MSGASCRLLVGVLYVLCVVCGVVAVVCGCCVGAVCGSSLFAVQCLLCAVYNRLLCVLRFVMCVACCLPSDEVCCVLFAACLPCCALIDAC